MQPRFALFVSLALCAAASAQEFRGTITGRVIDAQAAVIPGVRVLATQVDTGTRYETVSSGDGQYTLPFLAPGMYRLSAEAAGFKRYVRESVQVSTNERTALDILLEIGALAETVTVTEETSLLETATASTGQVINQRQIEYMPLNGRSPLVLAQLAFGVVPSADPMQSRPYDDSRQSTFSMGGAPAGKNELLMDGAPDTNEAGRIAFSPPVDNVIEVKVESFQADAAYGHTGGGTVNLVTRGGTNTFHGSASEFNQVSKLAATQFFTNRAGQTKAVTRYNQWGVTAGGPVYIPKVVDARNRVFVHFTYEAIKTGLPQPNTLTVPTAAERTGDLSALLKAGSNYQIYDPLTGAKEGSRVRRQMFPGNIIPANRISPIAAKLLGFYGMPNQAGRADGRDNYLANTITDDNYNSETGRLDLNLTDHHKVMFNFRHNARFNLKGNNFGNIATGTRAGDYNSGAMLDHVWSLSPSTVVNTRMNWARSTTYKGTNGDGFDFTTLGLPASIAAASPLIFFPNVSVGAFATLGNGNHGNSPFDNFQLFSSLNRIHGRHNLKMGADLRLVRYNSISYGNSSGSYSFGNNWTTGPLNNSTSAPLGQDLAALLLGMPTGGGFDLNASQATQAGYYALFLHDDFRAGANLTFNIGLRYERDTPTTERFNRTVRGFDFTSLNPVSAAASAAYDRNPIPEIARGQFRAPGGLLFANSDRRNLYSTGAHNFSPRIGVAWKPGGKTVLRGGAGVFFYSLGKRGIDQTGFSQNTPIVPTLDGYLTPNASLSNPFPSGFLQPTGSSLGLATYVGRGVGSDIQRQVNPYCVRWNLDVQRQLPGNMVVEAGYFGNHAVHLGNNREMNYLAPQYLSSLPYRDQATIDRLTANVTNPFAGLAPGTSLDGSTVRRQQLLLPYPEFTGVSQGNVPEASSYFHMFQARVEKRFSHGFQFLANYLYSKMIERSSRLNDFDPQLEKRIGADDRPQRLVLSGSWELPFGKSGGAVVRRLAGGWTLNPIYVAQPGAPLSWGNVIYYGGPLNLNARAVDGAFDVNQFNRNSRDQLASNIRTFPTLFGNLRQSGWNNVDFSVAKNTQITERIKLQYRCEFFNLLNHPSFGAPNRSPTASNFGQITDQVNLSRSIQMGLKLAW